MPHTNHLVGEQSPYLLQHAENPVDWYPWGEEAFAKAKKEDKPIFLSVGYSTCHWCHVMAHESFENEEIAKFLNEHFVNIKVDREERPDVDRIYMGFVQATTGSGGWPMSVWLTQKLEPFVGGTYFPPTDKYGRPGFLTVLKRVADAWQTNREGVVKQGEKMTEALQSQTSKTDSGELAHEPMETLLAYAGKNFDAEWGGFGNAPKFPRPSMLHILLRCSVDSKFSNADQTSALRCTRETLRQMARGGMNDQLGGGFHRYSVDRFWHVPHFEKMLYDQAQLAIAYLDNWRRSSGGEASSRQVVGDILHYVARDLLAPEGGFYSAEDADSLVSAQCDEKREGAFYVWTLEEIQAVLGDDAEAFAKIYDVHPAGNAPDGSDPHEELIGKNVLWQKLGITGAAKATGKSKEEIEKLLIRCKAKLLAVRNERPRPHRDEKILTGWNGLMISAYAQAGAALQNAEWLKLATNAADFLLTKSKLANGELSRSYMKTVADIGAFADDYAFLVAGLLDLYEATFASRWITEATRLQEEQDKLFYDEKGGGYFSTRKDSGDLIARLKDDYDGAEPSANSVAAINLLRLSTITGKEHWRKQAEQTLKSFMNMMQQMPQAVPQMLVALDLALQPPRQLVLAGDPAAKDFQLLAREAWRRFLPPTSLILAQDSELNPPMIDGKATAYLCENFVCKLPVTGAAELAKLLE